MDRPTEESSLELLVGRQTGDIHDGIGPVWTIGAISARARHRTSYEAAIKAPVEADPRQLLRRLVLQVPGCIEKFVMIDAEYTDRARSGANSRDLRPEEARRHAGGHHESS